VSPKSQKTPEVDKSGHKAYTPRGVSPPKSASRLHLCTRSRLSVPKRVFRAENGYPIAATEALLNLGTRRVHASLSSVAWVIGLEEQTDEKGRAWREMEAQDLITLNHPEAHPSLTHLCMSKR
jgi:hypothetical protein